MDNSQKNKVTELVIYTIKPEVEVAEFKKILQLVREKIASTSGFISYDSHQAIGNSLQFFDSVSWDSIENAQLAASIFPDLEETKAFFNCVEETSFIKFFQNFN